MRFMMGLTAAVVIAGAAAAQTTPMVTYFGAGADDLDPAALAILDGVVDQARAKTESWSVVVAGHADASEGSADEAVGLSQRRGRQQGAPHPTRPPPPPPVGGGGPARRRGAQV